MPEHVAPAEIAEATDGGQQAVAGLYNALMTGLVLALVTRRGEAVAARFVHDRFMTFTGERSGPDLRFDLVAH